MHSNHTLKSKPFHPTLHEKVSPDSPCIQMVRMKLTRAHFLTLWGASMAWQGTQGSIKHISMEFPSMITSKSTHFKNPFLASTTADVWMEVWSRLIKFWKYHFIPLSWNIFSFTSSLGGAGGGAGGLGLSFGFSITFFSGSGS